MSVATLIETCAAGLGAGIGAAEYARRRFRHAVQEIIDKSIVDVIARQAEFEHRQAAHLDRQDAEVARLTKAMVSLIHRR